MAKDRPASELDRELADLPPELRWREWMRRIEAVLFASASPVGRDDLARVVGQGASVDLLVEDLSGDFEERSFEIAQVAGGWMFRTRAAYGPAIRLAADVDDQLTDLDAFDVAVLAAVAYQQPITRDGLMGYCHVNSPSLQVDMPDVDQGALAADFHASNASSRW
ncbi:Segregation and condensation protein B (plasmid) [Sulfitobacter indolifex]|uniref:SMC-Scp complex subunit ScpB n=1 Tax=Sulfitobacter indolifex TaxID=225422 RepID=UPI00206F40AA|nr:Segregation and condensation protein B [Sulfitobacter indolifex]